MTTKERPIIMTSESVCAILSGAKSMTRRIVKPQPDANVIALMPRATHAGNVLWGNVLGSGKYVELTDRTCPYGKPGDRLWVRETLREGDDGVWLYAADNEPVGCDRADEGAMLVWVHHKESPICSSIHMPRWASRLTLKIVSIQVERLQDISATDARAEGCSGLTPWMSDHICDHDLDARCHFEATWNSINGAKPGCSWADNPWVWAITFRRVTP